MVDSMSAHALRGVLAHELGSRNFCSSAQTSCSPCPGGVREVVDRRAVGCSDRDADSVPVHVLREWVSVQLSIQLTVRNAVIRINTEHRLQHNFYTLFNSGV